MPDVIQCPTCSKKFRLPDRPPATFTCTSCGTVMDLSGFAAAAPPAPAPAAAPPPAPTRGGGSRGAAPTRGGGGGRHHARAGRGHGRGRGRDEEEEAEEGGRGRRAAKKSSMPLVLGLVAGVVVVGVVVVLMMNKNKGNSVEAPKVDKAAAPAATPPKPAETPPEPAKEKPKAAPGTSGSNYVPTKAEVKTYPYTDDVSADDRNKIDEAVNAAVEVGGRDGVDAEKFLVGEGLKAAPRLISEFKHIEDKYSFEKSDGLSRAMVVDRILRKIDGVQERKFHDTKPINANSDPIQALKTAKNWNWWWDTGAYKTPMKPWDPRVDEKDQGDAGDQ
jgi:hypothetical protein